MSMYLGCVFGQSDQICDQVTQSNIRKEMLTQLHVMGERLTSIEKAEVKKTTDKSKVNNSKTKSKKVVANKV